MKTRNSKYSTSGNQEFKHADLWSRPVIALVVTAVLAGASAGVRAQLEDLGTFSGGNLSAAYGVSADGSVVVGYADEIIAGPFPGSGYLVSRAFRWTAATGMQSLGVLEGYISRAFAVNADGRVVVGYSTEFVPGDEGRGGDYFCRAFRWTAEGGMQSLGFLDNGMTSFAYAVSADGNVVVGYADEFFPGPVPGTGELVYRAFRWTDARGMVSLGTLGGHSIAFGVSADGSVVVGQANDGAAGNALRAFRWTESDGTMYSLGTLNGGDFSAARGINTDGSVVVGHAADGAEDNNDRAFLWTEDTGMKSLGVLEGYTDSYANGVSGDGRVVVGYSSEFVPGVIPGSGDDISHAFRWTERTGMQTVEDWLRDSGVTVRDDLVTNTASATNYDGSVVVGTLESGTAFIARGASGLVTLEDVAVSLGSAARGTGMALSSGNTVFNGAHSRPLDRRIAAGQKTLWVSGDFGRDDHGPRDGDFKLAELGGGMHLGSMQVNAALGLTRASQSLGEGSKVDVEGTYLLAEGLMPMAGASSDAGLWLVASAYYHSGEADIRRAYLNAGLPDASTGSPGVDTLGVRLRVEWEQALNVLNAALSPYADLSHTRAKLDAYSETGGGFPAGFDSREDKATELRLGVNAVRKLASPGMRLLGSLEYAHRFEDSGASTSGEIIGLFGFNLPGEAYKQDWLRAGAGIEANLGGGKASAMVNVTTEGEVPNLWIAATWQRVF